MTIKSYFAPNSHFVEVQLCSKSRKDFARASLALRNFLRKGTPPLEASIPPAVHDSWLAGLDAIERLAFIPSQIVFIDPMAAAGALSLLTSFILASNKRAAKRHLVPLFGIASITPLTLPSLDLPLFPEAWTHAPASDEAMEIFERARSQSHGNVIRLTQAHLLFAELESHTHSEESVRTLTEFLGDVSEILRIAVRHSF